jgi:hypothetical protein
MEQSTPAATRRAYLSASNNVATASTWPHARNLLQILTNKICHDIRSNVDAISECSLVVFSSN